jgi:hypothetical protein
VCVCMCMYACARVCVPVVLFCCDNPSALLLQRFDPAGHFKCLYLVNESRVIDSVSGAVEEFHAAAASPS